MRRLFTLCLLALLPILFLSSCSDDDNNASSDMEELVGAWIEDTSSTEEVHHLTLKDNGTGRFYISNDGKVDENGLMNITWFASDGTFSMRIEGGEVETSAYFISNGKFHVGEVVYKRLK